jgi:hypothetical protein
MTVDRLGQAGGTHCSIGATDAQCFLIIRELSASEQPPPLPCSPRTRWPSSPCASLGTRESGGAPSGASMALGTQSVALALQRPSSVPVTVIMRMCWGTVMLRVVACVALLVSGCAVDPPAPIIRTKIVKEYIPEPTPPTPEASCNEPVKRTCGQMATCAEAAHYFFKCGVERLDGHPKNGIPCEKLCVRASKDSTAQKKQEMCDRIRRAPMFMSEGRMSVGFMPPECK